MKISLAIISVAASFLLSAANTPWLPAKKEVQFRPRLGKENVQIMRLNGERFASGKFFKQQSLNGTWKFKGLDCQAKPFGKMKPPVSGSETGGKLIYRRFLLLFKSVFAQTADGADPIFGNVFPGSAGGHTVIGIADSGIVFIAAGAGVFIHSNVSF